MDEKNILSDLAKFFMQVDQVIKKQDSFSKEYVTEKELKKAVQSFAKQAELFAQWMNQSKKTTETLVSKEIAKVVSMLNETSKRLTKITNDKGLVLEVKIEALNGELRNYIDTIKWSSLGAIEEIKQQLQAKLEQKDIEWLIAKSNETIIDDIKQWKEKTYSSNKIEELIATRIKSLPIRRDAAGGSPVFIKDANRDWWFANILKFVGATVDIVNNETVITISWSWDFVPYTGATQDVNLWAFALIANTWRAATSAGVLIESANGTDIGLLWAWNTANVTWYGSHNYSTATQDTIAIFTGAWKTLWSAALATYPSLAELAYVKWVTSAIQTQLNTKITASSTDTLTNKTLTSPVLTTPVLWTPSSWNLSNCTADWTDEVWFRNIPANSQSAAYTTVLSDKGKSIDHPSTDANARTFTIAANASVAYPVGTTISFSNMTSQVVTIAINSDTMYLAWTGTTGSRSLAQYGVATARKLTSTTWIISGIWLT